MQDITLVVSFNHGSKAQVAYIEPNDVRHRPLLVLRDGTEHGGRVFIEASLDYPAQVITEDHVRFARELVDVANEYLAEIERAYEHDLLAAFEDELPEEGEWQTGSAA